MSTENRAQVQITKEENSGKFRTYKYTFPDGVGPTSKVSDGYHTFAELYHYRALYNAAWLNAERNLGQHKSRKHSDGKFCFDADGEWFVVVVQLPTGQITNHYHSDYWGLFDIPEKETADEWDGHTPEEAAKRLSDFMGWK